MEDFVYSVYLRTHIWYILRTFGIFYEPLVYFVTIWYIFCTKKIWQPLINLIEQGQEISLIFFLSGQS
jgi:hypothetical protein